MPVPAQQLLFAYKSLDGGGGLYVPWTNPWKVCGAECARTSGNGHHAVISGVSYNNTDQRSGDYCFGINLVSLSAWSINIADIPPDVITFRFYMKFDVFPSADRYFVYTGSLVNDRLGLAFNTATNTVHCASGSTPSFQGAGFAINTGVWYRFDVKMDQTSGAKRVDARVDGNVLTEATVSGTAAASALTFGSAGQTVIMTAQIDDILILEGGTHYPIGAGYVESFRPIADGTHVISVAGNFSSLSGTNFSNASTDVHTHLDRIPFQANNEYVIAKVSDINEYVEVKMGQPAARNPVTPPRAIDVCVIWAGASTAEGHRRISLVDNATVDHIVDLTSTQGTSVVNSRKAYGAPPSGATEWNLGAGGNGDFENLFMRFGSSDATPNQRWQHAFIEAEFA